MVIEYCHYRLNKLCHMIAANKKYQAENQTCSLDSNTHKEVHNNHLMMQLTGADVDSRPLLSAKQGGGDISEGPENVHVGHNMP